MTIEQDKERLLDVLYAIGTITGSRPSIVEAKAHYLSEWGDERLSQAEKTLDADGDILNSVTSMRYVDLSTAASRRAAARYSEFAPLTIQIGRDHKLPPRRAGTRDRNVLNMPIAIDKATLQAIIDLYHSNVSALNLDPLSHRKSNAQVATIEAQMQDEPDPIIISIAGKSLRAVIEAALSGRAGNVAPDPARWAPLLELFR